MIKLFFITPLLLSSISNLTFLDKAEQISKDNILVLDKRLDEKPNIEKALSFSSTWLMFNASKVGYDAGGDESFDLSNESSYLFLNELGFDGLYPRNLLSTSSFDFSPKWSQLWPKVTQLSQKYRFGLIGDSLQSSLPQGQDFLNALQNDPKYVDLFHLIEIPSHLWSILPAVNGDVLSVNVPWLTLQTLQAKGLVPEKFTPYVKESAWDASREVLGIDGKNRRFIYLKNGKNEPSLNWLSPLFSSYRAFFGKSLFGAIQGGFLFQSLPCDIPEFAQNIQARSLSKIGIYSFLNSDGLLKSYAEAKSDFLLDVSTPSACMHSLITQETESLKMIYRMFLDAKIDSRRFIHALTPLDQNACEWTEILKASKNKYKYYDEELTENMLKNRLLNSDVQSLHRNAPLEPSNWVDYCSRALQTEDFTKNKEIIQKAHLLLTFFYAMQGGALALDYNDLVGMLPRGKSPEMLYLNFQGQKQNSGSFIYQTQKILQMRSNFQMPLAQLEKVLSTQNPSCIILIHRLPTSNFLQFTCVNFSSHEIEETIHLDELKQTRCINMMNSLEEKKEFSSSQFSFTLAPLAGKAFYFCPNIYP